MKLEDVESARQAYHKKIKTEWMYFWIISGIFVVAALALGGASGGFSLFGALFALFFFGIVYLIVSVFLNRKVAEVYRNAYKSYFVARNLASVFTNLTYQHNLGLSKEVLRQTGMINTGDDYSSNDLTIAKYKNIDFSQADATIQIVSTDSDGNTTYTTIFKGRFMIFEFPKKFDFKLELIGKKFHAYRVPGKDQATSRKMSKIKTESEEFNRTFKIYGQDGFESFYLLDPAMIVKIQAISEYYKNKILIGFYDNKMLVALDDGKDSFEPPRASRPINEAEEMRKVASSVKVITDFVDIISSR